MIPRDWGWQGAPAHHLLANANHILAFFGESLTNGAEVATPRTTTRVLGTLAPWYPSVLPGTGLVPLGTV